MQAHVNENSPRSYLPIHEPWSLKLTPIRTRRIYRLLACVFQSRSRGRGMDLNSSRTLFAPALFMSAEQSIPASHQPGRQLGVLAGSAAVDESAW